MNKLSPLAVLAFAVAFATGAANAQSSCSSDGQAPPTGLLERFINADCEGCWADVKPPRPAARQVAVDWIAPGSRGDDAPLSAAATRDALARLDALRVKRPPSSDSKLRTVQGNAQTLRVAHGLPFNGYIGASIELKSGNGGPWTAWLLLVETVSAGVEGTVVERNLVRNALQVSWDGKTKTLESRSMGIPEGAKPERLRVVGWVEDARGRIRAIAQSKCTTETTKE